MVLVDLAMAFAKMWVAHAMSVPQVQAKWSWLPGGTAIAAAENAANRSVMMANLGMSVATSAMQIAALDKQKMATGGMIGGKVVEHNLYRKQLETKTFDYFDDNDYDRGARVNAERIYNIDAVGAAPDDITNTNISVISNSKNKSDEDRISVSFNISIKHV